RGRAGIVAQVVAARAVLVDAGLDPVLVKVLDAVGVAGLGFDAPFAGSPDRAAGDAGRADVGFADEVVVVDALAGELAARQRACIRIDRTGNEFAIGKGNLDARLLLMPPLPGQQGIGVELKLRRGLKLNLRVDVNFGNVA